MNMDGIYHDYIMEYMDGIYHDGNHPGWNLIYEYHINDYIMYIAIVYIITFWWVVEPTPLKNMIISQLG